MTQDRLFKTIKNNEHILLTWSQRRCKICQRFLGVRERVYCSVHRKLTEKYSNRSEYCRLYSLIDKEIRRCSYNTIKNFIGMELPSSYRNKLGVLLW
jgi:hypothetical protein